jgi:hypothetical protein
MNASSRGSARSGVRACRNASRLNGMIYHADREKRPRTKSNRVAANISGQIQQRRLSVAQG